MKLIWKILRSHISVAQLTGFFLANLAGMVIILIAVQLYHDVKPILSQPDSFMNNDYLILSKKVIAGGDGQNNFTAAEIQDLTAEPFIEDFGKFMAANYEISASISMGGAGMSSYLFFEAVPDRFLDVSSERWKFKEGDEFIPVVLPKNYLNLYNFGFAQSQGLPQITPELLEMVVFDIAVRGNGKTGWYKGRIAALSNRLNTILVPQSFIEWSNKEYGSADESDPSRLIVEVRNTADEDLRRYIKSHNYEIEGDKQDSGGAGYFLRLATGIVSGIGILITALSIYILMLSIFLLLQKNSRKLEDLLLLGYTPSQVSRPYIVLTFLINLGVFLFAMIVVLIVRGAYLPFVGMMWDGEVSTNVFISAAAGLLIAVIISAFNALAIRRKVVSLWRYERIRT